MKNFITIANYFVLILVIFFFNKVRCEMVDNCNFRTCGECISFASERCIWCAQDSFNDRRCRPRSYKHASKTWCKDIIDPEAVANVERNQTFSSTVQFRPQQMTMKGPPGIAIPFDMSFKPAKDYPLDVYYLMDTSFTMRTNMNDLKEQAKEIHRDLSQYTNNVKLGIGSFIEKPGFPYYDRNNPTKEQSHAFKNLVALTDNMTQFESAINDKMFGSNFDEPEAGLDALMQAMKCIDEIGWRPSARRIIVLCTDSTYHSAGDGKIVGAIKPNDMQCHLKDNTYSESLTYDYPSVSQINQAAVDGRFKIIFALGKKNKCPKKEYENLPNQIRGSNDALLKNKQSVIQIIKDAYEKFPKKEYDDLINQINRSNDALLKNKAKIIGIIEEACELFPEKEYKDLTNQIHGSNYALLKNKQSVIQIIKDAYEESANSVKMTVKAPHFIEVTIDQNCESEPKRNCESPHKQTLNITGTVKIKSCPGGDYKNPTYITVSPEGLHDKLEIRLDLICKCDCEAEIGAITPKVCNGAGFLQCGICKCNPGSYGENCQCNGTSTDKTDSDKCKLNANSSSLCSGQALCICGRCGRCNDGYSGDFCEFNDALCPKANGDICAKHGNCTRGQCRCDNEWTGEDCNCPTENKSCIAPYSKEVCSGRGTCVCGVCKCDALEGKNETYFGAFCDSCEECAQQRCKELENYAHCNYMHKTDKDFCDQENNKTKQIQVSFMRAADIHGPKLFMAKLCKKVIDANGTYMVFKYQYEDNVLKITIQEESETPPEPNIWLAVGTAIGLVLLIGILTVIVWKILVDLHDKKEYEKFSAEALSQGYDVSQNPLYQDPSINFSNPVYNNQCN